MKYTVYRIDPVATEITIPDRCPDCGHTISSNVDLIVWDWIAQQCTVGTEGEIEPLGRSNYEATFTDAVHCKYCDHEFSGGRQILEGGDTAPRAEQEAELG